MPYTFTVKEYVPETAPDGAEHLVRIIPEANGFAVELIGDKPPIEPHVPGGGEWPSLYIERQPGGWVIVLHPDNGDPSGTVKIMDDGRTFAHHDGDSGSTVPMEMLDAERWDGLS